MTAITLATFRTRARQLGDYENSTVFTDAVMTPWVNEAIGDYFDLLDEHFDGYRDTTGTVTTTAASRETRKYCISFSCGAMETNS